MTQTVTAVYENGVLRPDIPLAVPEGTRVEVTVGPPADDSPGQRTAAVMRRIAARRVQTGPVEYTSETVDDILYGKKDSP